MYPDLHIMQKKNHIMLRGSTCT